MGWIWNAPYVDSQTGQPVKLSKERIKDLTQEMRVLYQQKRAGEKKPSRREGSDFFTRETFEAGANAFETGAKIGAPIGLVAGGLWGLAKFGFGGLMIGIVEGTAIAGGVAGGIAVGLPFAAVALGATGSLAGFLSAGKGLVSLSRKVRDTVLYDMPLKTKARRLRLTIEGARPEDSPKRKIGDSLERVSREYSPAP